MSAKSDICKSLPVDIAESIRREGPPLSFAKFSEWLQLDKNMDSVWQTIYLNPVSHKIVRPETHKRKNLSRTARKKLGLYTLNNEVTYDQMSVVHNLWKSYMSQLLDIRQLEEMRWDNSPQHVLFEQLNLKLYRADYHGAYLTVMQSTCPSLVGRSGIVVMDTKNTFRLIDHDNVNRTIPKKSCQFQFHIGNFKFTFYGQNFIVRSADRINKKVKQVKPQRL